MSTVRHAHSATFSKVVDRRKQPIRGLWHHGREEDASSGSGGKDSNAVHTVAEAREAIERLKVQRTDNTQPTAGYLAAQQDRERLMRLGRLAKQTAPDVGEFCRRC